MFIVRPVSMQIHFQKYEIANFTAQCSPEILQNYSRRIFTYVFSCTAK